MATQSPDPYQTQKQRVGAQAGGPAVGPDGWLTSSPADGVPSIWTSSPDEGVLPYQYPSSPDEGALPYQYASSPDEGVPLPTTAPAQAPYQYASGSAGGASASEAPTSTADPVSEIGLDGTPEPPPYGQQPDNFPDAPPQIGGAAASTADTNAVAGFYQKYLGRAANPDDPQKWLSGAYGYGTDLATIENAIKNSDEARTYAAHQASKAAAPTTAPPTQYDPKWFTDLVGRAPTQAENDWYSKQPDWMAQLKANTPQADQWANYHPPAAVGAHGALPPGVTEADLVPGARGKYYAPGEHGPGQPAMIGLPDGYYVQNPDGSWGAFNPRGPEGAGGGGSPSGVGSPNVGAPAPNASPSDFQAKIRQSLLDLINGANAPVDENATGIGQAMGSARDEVTRAAEAERTALAERMYAQGGGGLQSNALTQQIQQSSEHGASALSGLHAGLVMQQYQAKQARAQQALSLAVQTGDAESARAAQLTLAQLQAAIQREQLAQQNSQFADSLGFNYNSLLSGMNRDALLHALGLA